MCLTLREVAEHYGLSGQVLSHFTGPRPARLGWTQINDFVHAIRREDMVEEVFANLQFVSEPERASQIARTRLAWVELKRIETRET